MEIDLFCRPRETLDEIDRENISDNSTPSGENQNVLGPIVSRVMKFLKFVYFWEK